MDEMETNLTTEKALPEPILIKQTFLKAFWECINLFQQYKALDSIDDKFNSRLASQKMDIRIRLSVGVMGMFLALRNK